MNSRLLITLALLIGLSTVTSGCALSSKSGVSAVPSGSFCRIYLPIPTSEGSGPTIERNEVRYCVMCDPTCPDSVIEAWQRAGGVQ